MFVQGIQLQNPLICNEPWEESVARAAFRFSIRNYFLLPMERVNNWGFFHNSVWFCNCTEGGDTWKTPQRAYIYIYILTKLSNTRLEIEVYGKTSPGFPFRVTCPYSIRYAFTHHTLADPSPFRTSSTPGAQCIKLIEKYDARRWRPGSLEHLTNWLFRFTHVLVQ